MFVTLLRAKPWRNLRAPTAVVAIIYGLMAICMVWAPENEMNCLFFMGFRFIAFNITLYWLAIFYLILSLVMQAFEGLTWG